MLFVSICRAKPELSNQERIERRTQWEYPEGMNLVAEYWPVGSDIDVIVVAEAESPAPIMAAVNAWDDALACDVLPVLTAEEGLELAAQT